MFFSIEITAARNLLRACDQLLVSQLLVEQQIEDLNLSNFS